MDREIEKRNGRIMAVFLFQYSLLIPLMSFINPSSLVAATGLFLLALLFFFNRTSPVKMRPLVFALCMMVVVLLKTLLDPFGNYSLLFNFFTIACPVICLYMYSFDADSFLQTGFKLAVINFAIICWNPLTLQYAYMRFGYGMLLTVIFAYIKVTYFSKETGKHELVIYIVLLVVSIVELVVLGARGAIFSLLLFVGLDVFLVNRKHLLRNGIFAGIGILGYVNILHILDFFDWIARKLGVYSYSIMKFKLQVSSGWAAASSGRDSLYRSALVRIREHPLIGGPISIGAEDDVYVHNLFLQTAIDLGVIALVVLILFLGFLIVKIISSKTEKGEKLILMILFSVAVGRLMFNSVLWRRPEFWMLMCYGFSCMSQSANHQGTHR